MKRAGSRTGSVTNLASRSARQSPLAPGRVAGARVGSVQTGRTPNHQEDGEVAVSFNQMLVDQPQPEIARSAVILGEVHVGAGAILAQGLVVRAHGAAVSIGNYSAILENGVVIGTAEHPVRVGQRTVFGHRAAIVGAAVGDLCEIGNGAILMPGSRLGSGCILGEGTLVPPGTVIPAGSVLVGRPPGDPVGHGRRPGAAGGTAPAPDQPDRPPGHRRAPADASRRTHGNPVRLPR